MYDDVDFIKIAKVTAEWLALVNAVMNIRIRRK